jgi:hypothetical protein
MNLTDNLHAQELIKCINHGNFKKTLDMIEKHPQLKESIFLFTQGGFKTYHGTTALHHCILHSQLNAVEYFLKQGVSANLENIAQFKAVDFARYLALTVFEGTDTKTHNIYTLLDTYAQKERLEKSITHESTNKPKVKI